MGKQDRYKIDLKSMSEDCLHLDFQMEEEFFVAIDAPEIQHGNLCCNLEIKQNSGGYMFCFHTEGVVMVTCDRCLDEMELQVDTTDYLTVKLGPEPSDEGDDLIVVSEDEGVIDVAWYLYEFVVLSLPIQYMHEEGECNEVMLSELDKHSVTVAEENLQDGEQEADPRWNELKKILDNN